MTRLPPPTPFLPNLKYTDADESLLITSQPVFDNLTLDEADFLPIQTGSSIAGPSRISYTPLSITAITASKHPQIIKHTDTRRPNRTLDLDEYLTGDETVLEESLLEDRGIRVVATSEGGEVAGGDREESVLSCSSTSQTGSLKRYGGDTPMKQNVRPKKREFCLLDRLGRSSPSKQ